MLVQCVLPVDCLVHFCHARHANAYWTDSTSKSLMRTHKIMLALADLMFLLTTAHISILLYETFTNTVPPRVLQSAVAVAQLEVRHRHVALHGSDIDWRRASFILSWPSEIWCSSGAYGSCGITTYAS